MGVRKNDYQRYVIAEGRLVGDFERMYRECRDPWQIRTAIRTLPEYELILAFIRHHRAKTRRRLRILEIGSGKGHFTARLAELGEVTGIEVSPTAIRHAQRRVPDARFVCADLNTDRLDFPRQFDIVVFYRVVWYLIPGLVRCLQMLRSALRPDGLGIFEINYYRGKYYGRDRIRGKNDYLRLLQRDFRVRETLDLFPDTARNPSCSLVTVERKR